MRRWIRSCANHPCRPSEPEPAPIFSSVARAPAEHPVAQLPGGRSAEGHAWGRRPSTYFGEAVRARHAAPPRQRRRNAPDVDLRPPETFSSPTRRRCTVPRSPRLPTAPGPSPRGVRCELTAPGQAERLSAADLAASAVNLRQRDGPTRAQFGLSFRDEMVSMPRNVSRHAETQPFAKPLCEPGRTTRTVSVAHAVRHEGSRPAFEASDAPPGHAARDRSARSPGRRHPEWCPARGTAGIRRRDRQGRVTHFPLFPTLRFELHRPICAVAIRNVRHATCRDVGHERSGATDVRHLSPIAWISVVEYSAALSSENRGVRTTPRPGLLVAEGAEIRPYDPRRIGRAVGPADPHSAGRPSAIST